MSDIKEWDNEAVIMLVKEYAKREELWRREHNMYRVQTVKHAAWKSIARMFTCNTADVKKKFNSILASHRRERMKVKGGRMSSWFLYPHLKFLREYVRIPVEEQEEISTEHFDQETLVQFSTSHIDSDEAQVVDDDQEMDLITIKDEPEEQVEAFTREELSSPDNKCKRTRVRRTLKRRRRPMHSNIQDQSKEQGHSQAYVDSKILELQSMMQKESRQRKDDCDTYGEYIASMLRKRDKKARCLIKQAINNVLFQQEMNEYENPLDPDMESEVLEQSDE